MSARARIARLLLLMMLVALPLTASADKLDHVPPIFAVTHARTDKLTDDGQRFVVRETLTTQSAAINDLLTLETDSLEQEMLPQVPPDTKGKAQQNSRLDMEITYARTGQSWLSALIIGRVTRGREQIALGFRSIVADLETGKRVTLNDLFAGDSPAWALLSQRAGEHLSSVFPGQARNEQAIERFATPHNLANAAFSLGGQELTLHLMATDVGIDLPYMIHIRFYYPEFAGMMTEQGARQTDNRHFKMVALTFDDGPVYFNSIHTLNALRAGGARATFFQSGVRYAENAGVVRRQFDANHAIASHSFKHKSGYVLSPEGMKSQITQCNDALEPLTGVPVTLFRAPGGLWPPWQKQQVGLPIIQWSVDTYDYAQTNKYDVAATVKKYTRDGDIILMHDSRTVNHKAMPLIADWLTSNGYLMVSVEELAWAQGVTLQPNIVYARFFEGQYNERRDSNLN